MAETAATPLPPGVDPLEPRMLVPAHHDDASLNETLLDHVWRKPGKGWFMLFGIALA
jgi:hypothetical protein